ncbi:PrsW family glutamic-type intramembrane protease [Hamadaea tsunoensis]|uniref:PrsW family glutamic-type intramembrane protease n=1 Tax=Hamadaea tsunoensis TaxID=53368 RepID=UPI00040D87BD|nr:PrsW family glutamic-type intramembrane protease [Hamadaea tsunoensis]
MTDPVPAPPAYRPVPPQFRPPATFARITPPEDPAAYRLGRLLSAFAIGLGLVLLILVAAAVAIARDDEETLRVFGIVNLVICGVVLLAAVVAATVGFSVGASTSSARTRWRAWAIGGGLVFAVPGVPLLFFALAEMGVAWRGVGLTIPTTLFALWAFRRMQRNHRAPWRLILAAWAWGAVVASYFAQMVEGTLHVIIQRDLLPGTATIIAHAAAAAGPEELVKAAGVVVLVLLFRRRIDGMLGGIVLGACVGLGFQFAESLSYMTHDFDSVLYQHWYRQVTGLLVSHATYAGIIGAGVGLALQLPDWGRRILSVGGAFAFAVAAHLTWDAMAMGHFYLESANATLQLFVMQPLNLVLLKGPAFAALMFLVLLALRYETREVYRLLLAEAASGSGAITVDELPALIDPPRRFRLRLAALREGGLTTYRQVRRLQAAQLDLVFARWRRERGEFEPVGSEDSLRRRISGLRVAAHPTPAPVTPAPLPRPGS